ncbi:site-2 protease family protein [Luteitalea sp. TBR-22]|uniref:site-2 protease family protein n=1 Tax=Luteitalea sp. TBR-22 TaxID=2802971 RepID=UPI001EF659F2|nr:site-2 protease family protein [Luteitalea sp. TBR-22]
MEIGSIVLAFIGLLLALTVHEAAHAWAAFQLGDPTAKLQGRLSLNPAVHIDPIGTVMLPLLAFATGAPIIGWARPVPVDGRYLKHFRRDFMWIALAGPASNLLLAVLASLLLRALPHMPVAVGGIAIVEPLLQFAFNFFRVNVLLAVFNMIPVPPLDGSNVVAAVLPRHLAYQWDQIRPYGIFILYGLMFTGIVGRLIGPPANLLFGLLL